MPGDCSGAGCSTPMQDAAPQHRGKYLCFSCVKKKNPTHTLDLKLKLGPVIYGEEDIISTKASGGSLVSPVQQRWEEN